MLLIPVKSGQLVKDVYNATHPAEALSRVIRNDGLVEWVAAHEDVIGQF